MSEYKTISTAQKRAFGLLPEHLPTPQAQMLDDFQRNLALSSLLQAQTWACRAHLMVDYLTPKFLCPTPSQCQSH